MRREQETPLAKEERRPTQKEFRWCLRHAPAILMIRIPFRPDNMQAAQLLTEYLIRQGPSAHPHGTGGQAHLCNPRGA
ncbi:hypothetical protein KCP71_19840 [Salmonella enterica subsp. enterica]|nr:hypothetical protein KCP71_19840 [Salmonella enterica subsp. enterica]